MILLHNQTLFEKLIGRGDQADSTDLPPTNIIYFTARWCGACKRLDLTRLLGAYPLVAWYKCDIDDNDYTAGFCGIRSIPAFMVIKNKKILGTLASADTEKVLQWITETLATDKK
jgi:thioredoxin-like negative regulator of GroEL